MTAARGDADWPLVFPAEAFEGDGETIDRELSNARGPVPCRVIQRIASPIVPVTTTRSPGLGPLRRTILP
jgi:hypothetical protein